MRRTALPLLLAFASAFPIAGCGGDDGLSRDEPGLDTPAAAAPDQLYDAGTQPLRNPAGKRKEKQGQRRDKRKKPREGAVAGESETSNDAKRVGRGIQVGDVDAPKRSGGSLEGDDPEVAPAGPLSRGDEARIAAVKNTLYELFNRLNARDASLCTDMFTERHLQESTGASGDAAVERCRDDVSNAKLKYRVNRIYGVRIVGDKALIQFSSSMGPYAKHQILRLLLTDRWRFDGDGTEAAEKGL